VIEATEGPADHGRCVLREGPCPGDQPCPIHYVWSEARQVLVDGFAAVPAMPTHLKGALVCWGPWWPSDSPSWL
jgi:hypothetical protein